MRSEQQEEKSHNIWLLLTQKPALLKLSLVLAMFHFANAAMLGLVGQKLGLSHPGSESAILSASIVVAQLATIPTAIIAGRWADQIGYRKLLAVACFALVARAGTFSLFDSAPVLIAAQVLDGIAAGIWDVILPLFIATIAKGTGRYSATRGIVGTIQGIGGSLSNVGAGVVAVWVGYSGAFIFLGLFAVIAFGLVFLLPKVARSPS